MINETPQKTAIRLSQQLAIAYGDKRFPINILEFAAQYSIDICPNKNKCIQCTNKDCIFCIKAIKLSDKVDGLLKKTSQGWIILYNENIKYSGRINFTLAHELGHYLLHRKKFPDGLQCSKQDIMKGNVNSIIENEANTFASYLLMPLDDFRKTASKYQFGVILFQNLANRYATSLTATILKWIDMTNEKAMVVFSDNGFILWCRQSKNLLKTKLVPYKFDCKEVPISSLTYRAYHGCDIQHEKEQHEIWWGKGLVSQEIVFKAPQLEAVITVLLYEDNDAPLDEEDIEKDCFEMIPGCKKL